LKRRLCLFLLVTILTTALVPGLAAAESQISLTEAILLAKQAFPDLEDTDEFEFTSNYADSSGQGVWYLNWYNYQAEQRAEVNVQVNASTGEIIQFNKWQESDPNQVYSPLPKLDQREALNIAQRFLRGLIPEKFAQCLYQESAPPRPYLRERTWQQSYSFQFVRQVNGIPAPANYISITVNGDTGEILSYHLSWNDLDFPTPEGIITAEEATEALAEQGELELQYFWPYVQRGEEAAPVLAYSYPGINNAYVDAHTGELHSGYYYLDDKRQAAAPEAVADADGLSPQELAEVEHVAGLLTQQEAESQARQLVSVPEHLELQGANLYRDGRFPELRTWQLYFYSQYEGEERNYEYYHVRIDAKTGELYGLRHYWPHDNDIKVGTLTPEQAKNVADAFMQQYNPDKAAQVKLQDMPTKDEEEENALYYSFHYRRMVNDIPFVDNYITVTVKGEDQGIVTDYNVRWVETEFPSPDIALSQGDAYEQLVASYPWKQEYRLVSEPVTYDEAGRYVQPKLIALLTYRLENVPSTRFTPDQMLPMDYRGEVIKVEEAVLPQDVDGIPGAADIIFLSQVGIIQLENGMFYPQREITVGEWLEMLSRACGWSTGPIIILPRWAEAAADGPNAAAAQAAISAGLILPGENLDMSKLLTREELAVFAVRALGHEQVAAIPGIFHLDCLDADQVTSSRLGHVAIARGLGILVGEPNYYRPQATSTKATCATVLMRMLRLER
jgi:hypothetical protein